jgi:hypothetical protein
MRQRMLTVRTAQKAKIAQSTMPPYQWVICHTAPHHFPDREFYVNADPDPGFGNKLKLNFVTFLLF